MNSIVATNLKVVTALLLFVMASNTTYANQACGARSPLYKSMGDQYFHLDARPPLAPLAIEIKPEFLLKAMKEHSVERGYGERTICAGTGTNLLPNTVAVEIEDVNFQISGTGILLSAREFDSKSRESQGERIAIPTDSRHIITFSDGRFTGITRYRRPTSVGSFLEEVRLVLSPTNAAVTLSKELYINGDLAEWMDWVLIK